MDRQRVVKEANPSVLRIDSQSVKLSPMTYEHRGLDTHKRVNGSKRQLVVDTQGRLWAAEVHAAHQADGPAAVSLIGTILWGVGERLEKMYGDRPTMACSPSHWPSGALILRKRLALKRPVALFQ